MAEGDDARIDAGNDDDIRRWAKELGVGDVKLMREAVKQVGPRVGDVRRHLDQQMAGGQADAREIVIPDGRQPELSGIHLGVERQSGVPRTRE